LPWNGVSVNASTSRNRTSIRGVSQSQERDLPGVVEELARLGRPRV
jgi:hypothetical protein